MAVQHANEDPNIPVIFGEVVPQSICVRYGLPIGAWMAPAVLALMYVMSPIAWPVAKLLDRLLGEDHGTIYKKAGLKTLVTLHKTLGEAGEQLNSDEVTIISAVLDLKEKAVGSIMTPMDDVFTMSVDTVLDEQTMDVILSQGYSRIPIHAPDNPVNFVGMLLVKMLITYDPDDRKRVRDFALATLPETRPETSCLDIVNFFQEGKSHMVLVSEYPSEDRGALGVVTLEDVMEELIGEYVVSVTECRRIMSIVNNHREIIDESDVFIDVHKAIRRMAPAPKSRVPKGKIVEEPPTIDAVPEGQLVEVDGEATTPQESKTSTAERRRSSVEAPPPRFELRRHNTDKDSDQKSGWVTQRGATDEIREHLKHLGPSNLASRPRQTRYQNVKIKRGSVSPPHSGQTDAESNQSTSDAASRAAVAGLAGGIGAGILQSAGMDARDGVHAVKLGYGAIGPMVDRAKDTTPRPHKDSPQISVPEPVDEEQDEHQVDQKPQAGRQSAAASVRTGSSQSVDRLKPGSYKHPGLARSGSITEQVIDVNGIRKVVLHTTSSSENDEQTSPPPSRPEPPIQQSGKGDDSGDEQKTFNAGTSSSVAKKRRRKKKRGGQGSKNSDGRPNEQQPLLS